MEKYKLKITKFIRGDPDDESNKMGMYDQALFDLTLLHFPVKSLLTIIGAGLYQFTIFQMIVLMAYRTTWNAVEESDDQKALKF